MYYVIERHLQGEIALQTKPVTLTQREWDFLIDILQDCEYDDEGGMIMNKLKQVDGLV